ncbi:MAG TPA: tripartite tricarboxylate transporter substrate-binding protein [Hyphomicrobiaceae bacterium]|nr:tripartite tricarboxylate transporter substrate-binding protein [Hyphomicrobiaceae bacterium]
MKFLFAREAGVPGYETVNGFGVVAPAGTPAAIVERLCKEIGVGQNLPEIRKQFDADGAAVMQISPVQFGSYMVADVEKWWRLCRAPESRRGRLLAAALPARFTLAAVGSQKPWGAGSTRSALTVANFGDRTLDQQLPGLCWNVLRHQISASTTGIDLDPFLRQWSPRHYAVARQRVVTGRANPRQCSILGRFLK